MKEWKLYKLSDFIHFNPTLSLKKGTIAKKITMDQLIPYSREIYSWVNEPYSGGAKFQNGDTIMARITPCLENGKHAYVSILDNNEIAYGSTEYFVMRGIEGVSDNLFVYYLTHYPEFKNAAIKSMVGSSGRQRAQLDVLKNLEYELPDLEEQIQIATLLSSIDDKIALNKRINDNLEQQAQALYKSWFVDFDPFMGGEFVESEAGMIPKGWRVGNLLDVAELYDSRRKPLSGMQRSAMKKIYPYYGATSIMDYVDNYIFDGIYLLMGEDGSVVTDEGYPFLQYVSGKFWSNNHAHVMQGKNGFTTEMLHCFLLKKNISEIVTGAVQAKISQGNMKKISLIIAPDAILNEFTKILDGIYAKIRYVSSENLKLEIMRDSLLPKLMSGELKINEIDR